MAGTESTIGEGWASYLRDVVPAGASETQREECKRAFYAGAASMFTALLAAVTDDDEDVCAARVAALDAELSDYLRLFQKARGRMSDERTQHWAVTVERNGEAILTIETNSVSGKADLTDDDQNVIRMAAEHLRSFVGEPRAEP